MSDLVELFETFLTLVLCQGMRAANPSRARKVRKSMARIKHVLWERKLADDAFEGIEVMESNAVESH